MSQRAATRRFAFAVCEVLNSQRTPQQKLGAICRLTRVHKGLAGTEVAAMAGCGISHVYKLETGETNDLEGYRRVLDVLQLDREALLRFVTASQELEMSQVSALLLDGATTATSDDVNQSAWPAAEELLQAAFVRDVLGVLQNDWNKPKTLGEICRLTRQRRKLTQQVVGNRIGRSNMYISALESGQKPLDRYPPLVRALGLDDELLFRIIDEGPTADHTGAVTALLRAAMSEPPSSTPDSATSSG